MNLAPKHFLMPLSYAAVLGGCCTLIGTSTNLLVNDMASVAGQARFSIFEITPVGLAIAITGGLYILLFTPRLLASTDTTPSGLRPGVARWRAGPRRLPTRQRQRLCRAEALQSAKKRWSPAEYSSR